ncbi:hypothetical protein [Nitratireductor pacificus]|uniref:XRE family transcriptional regulator n=1 Tax=Nitratireductor pacificus pht-3B TaxID=391937 RepID=K2LH44_9HYPH|nr:hypothetical protein [Nitratireductor pacificus]EKF17084.1 hypothetical protein NA2_19978 [Nitratireductor pacificus pht-3B]
MAEIDRDAFACAVQAALGRRGLSYRAAVAAWPMLNIPMLSRACSCQIVSAANMLAVCKALELDPFAFLTEGRRAIGSGKSVQKQTVSLSAPREAGVRP